jgi:hydroxyacylglutathione hydrolase
LYDSLFGKILKLDDYVEVLPTHGAGSLCGRSISSKRTTTIGYERRFNVFLQKTDRQEFVDFVLDGNPYVPAYYQNMRPGNLGGADGFSAPGPRPLSVGEIQHALGHGALVIDTRSPGAYGGGHLPGAYNVGLGPMLATWVGSLLPSDVPIVLVLERPEDWTEVTTALGRIGYDGVIGYLGGGIETWQAAGLPLATVEQVDVQALERRRRQTPDLQIVDVRMAGEWESGHIPGATFVPLTDLPKRLVEIDRDRPTVVVCGSGYRSSIASAFLEQHGVRQLANMVGGMTAWNATDLPLTTESPAQTSQQPAEQAAAR